MDDRPNECGTRWEDAVNAYADGEIGTGEQPELFAHLTACSACRRQLDSILAFRRISNFSRSAVPPVVDAELMRRLDVMMKRRLEERQTDRSLWSAPVKVLAGKAVLVLVAIFLLGVGLATPPPPPPTSPTITMQQERVEQRTSATLWRVEPVYIFYPGLTVEAERSVE